MQDSRLETIRVTVDAQIGQCDMTGRGEGIQPGDEELPNSGCCIKIGGEASGHGSIKVIIHAELLTEAGDEFNSVWLPLLSFG